MKRKWIIICAVLVLIFIWLQSTVPESRSARESDWFTRTVVNPLLERFADKSIDKDVVRKVAHVAEFAVLSIFAVMFWKGKIVRSIYTGFTVAFLDESLQLVTGRGARVKDIWIDLIGVGVGTTMGWLIRRLKNQHA